MNMPNPDTATREQMLAYAKWNDRNGDFDDMSEEDLRAMLRDWANDVYGEH